MAEVLGASEKVVAAEVAELTGVPWAIRLRAWLEQP
ncbi:hypothetical protein FHT40_001910 [Mycolicibacterium sp. BK556]|nr:hypothetical protein [Mycolicibacterium sp. BK556]MBB3632029.1 hypothetical protein [Mycolicibacterium sp. BK607]